MRSLFPLAILALIAAWSASAPRADEKPVAKDSPASSVVAADEPKPASTPKGRSGEEGDEKTVEDLFEEVRKAVVVVTFAGRDGTRQGLGAGFVIDSEGLIATNRHVLGEARPIQVRTFDGKSYDVTTVHASDRKLDLALIRIDAKGLAALPLGDSDAAREGQSVVAIGNPQGLEHSVVSGVVSGRREIDDRSMIQLAIPIEEGNSGGPMVDRRGRVLGILTMKSVVTPNLGFAVAINDLKPLIEKPNPIPMARWLTIGALDKRDWTPLFGAHWTQRAGRLRVEGFGAGFGGRSLCLSRTEAPKRPFELAVDVRLDDETGAAGLIFCSDGAQKHYGFYPTKGALRLTRFDGPDVRTWNILDTVPSTHYRQGDWNSLKVRVEEGRIACFVNDRLVVESTDEGLSDGQIGLAKFRDTKAQFKNFRVAKQLPSTRPSAEAIARVVELLDGSDLDAEPKTELIDELTAQGEVGIRALRSRAAELDRQAEFTRRLALDVHHRRVQRELAKTLEGAETEIDLVHACLVLARLDNDELDVAAYRREFDRMADDLAVGLADDADDEAKLSRLDAYLFDELGFHGSRVDYYNLSNSYLNEVLDDREGLPITLAVVYMELARRIGLTVAGVGLPGHFVTKHISGDGKEQLIDVYERGRRLSRLDAAQMVLSRARRMLQDSDLEVTTKSAMVRRILQNLLGGAGRQGDTEKMFRYADTMVAILPDDAEARATRVQLGAQTDRFDTAIADLDWLLERRPEDIDLDKVNQVREALIHRAR